MRIFGLTGGIGAGKSTVARMFEEEGIPVVDADRIAREITNPGEDAYREIVRVFGKDVLHRDGTLDRKKLGGIVFSDPRRLELLESITHPRIMERIDGALRTLSSAGHPSAIVEAALILEKERTDRFEAVIAVWCGTEEQVRRLKARDSMSEEDIRLRIGAQMDPDAKAMAADYRIDNSGSLPATRACVRELVRRLGLRDRPRSDRRG